MAEVSEAVVSADSSLTDERTPFLKEALATVPADLQGFVEPILKHATVRSLLWSAYEKCGWTNGSLNADEFEERLRASGMHAALKRFADAGAKAPTLPTTTALVAAQKQRTKEVEPKWAKEAPAPMDPYMHAFQEFEMIRSLANDLMKREDWEAAARRYAFGLDTVENFLTGNPDKTICDRPVLNAEERKVILEKDGTYARANEMRIAFALNAALAGVRAETWPEALAAARRAAELAPENPKVYYRRAEALLGSGDPSGAVKDFERMLSLEVDDATRRQVGTKLRNARAKVEQNRSNLASGLEKSLQESVFSGARPEAEKTQPAGTEARYQPAPRRTSDAPKPDLTLERCRALLDDLEAAYSDAAVQDRIHAAAKAADYEMSSSFLKKLGPMLAPVQKPILEAYKFKTEDMSEAVAAMTRAIGYWSREDPEVQKQSLRVRKLAFGGELLEGMQEE